MIRLCVKTVVFLSALLLSCFTSARSLEEIQETGVIVFAVYQDFPPFSYLDDDNQARGIDVDIAKALAKELDVSIEFYWLQPDETLDDDLRNAIWKGHLVSKQKADIMLRVPYDPEYNRRVDPVTGEPLNEQVVIMAPYQTASWALLANADYLPELPIPAALVQQRIAVEVDSLPYTYLNFAMRGVFRNSVVSYLNTSEALNDFIDNEITVIIDTKARVEYLLHDLQKTHPELANQIVTFGGEKFLEGQKLRWDIGIAVHSNYRFLGYTVRKVLNKWVNNGFMETLFARYGVVFVPPTL